MTNLEFTQIMRDAGYERSADNIWQFNKFNNKEFSVCEFNKKDLVTVYLNIYPRNGEDDLCNWQYTFENISQMNSIEFKKKLEGITDYAYSLYMDINRHIDALSTKMETKAKRLGM